MKLTTTTNKILTCITCLWVRFIRMSKFWKFISSSFNRKTNLFAASDPTGTPYSSCTFEGQTLEHGETLTIDECTSCICEDSVVTCQTMDCPATFCEDPVKLLSKCCPVCRISKYTCSNSCNYYKVLARKVRGPGLKPPQVLLFSIQLDVLSDCQCIKIIVVITATNLTALDLWPNCSSLIARESIPPSSCFAMFYKKCWNGFLKTCALCRFVSAIQCYETYAI